MNGAGIGGSEPAKKYKLYISSIRHYTPVWLREEDGTLVDSAPGSILNHEYPPGKYTVQFGYDGVEIPFKLEEDSDYGETTHTVSKHLFSEPELCKFLDEIPKDDLVWIFRGATGINEHYMILYRKHELKKIK